MNAAAATSESHPEHRAYLLLGSNIQPEKYLPAACRELAGLGHIVCTSPVYESRAIGDVDSPNYLNAAVLLATSLSSQQLRCLLREIEARLGRVREPGNRNAARTIDIDIVLFNQECIKTKDLCLPNPLIRERLCVARPLADIDPNYVDPVTGQRLLHIAANLNHSARLTLRPDVILGGDGL